MLDKDYQLIENGPSVELALFLERTRREAQMKEPEVACLETGSIFRTQRAYYRLLRRLGRGGSADVWEAVDPQGLPVAMKILRSDADIDLRRVQQEVDVLTRVRSPYLVRVIDSYLTREPRFIVLSLIPGVDLIEWVDEHRHSSTYVVDFLSILIHITEAVSALHEACIVHRDLKPENVRVWPDEEGRSRARVLDCGIARDMSRDGRLSMGFTFPGTPGYMAPEQMTMKGDRGYPIDIYQLALIMWFGFSGGKPRFRDRADDEAMALYLSRLLEEARAHPHWPDLVPLPESERSALQCLLSEMLDFDPDKRPTIVLVKEKLKEMLKALAEWRPSAPVRRMSGIQSTTEPASWRGEKPSMVEVPTLPSVASVAVALPRPSSAAPTVECIPSPEVMALLANPTSPEPVPMPRSVLSDGKQSPVHQPLRIWHWILIVFTIVLVSWLLFVAVSYLLSRF